MVTHTLRCAAGWLMLGSLVACSDEPDPSARNHGAAPIQSVLEPPFGSFDQAPVSSIIAYAASLDYAEDRGVSDMQALSVRPAGAGPCPAGCTVGPRVTIQPQVGAIALSEAELRGGRVIGRLLNHDDVAYDRLNLSPGGTTYYVVVATDGGHWTGYLVSTDPARGSQSRVPHPVSVDAPHFGLYKEGLARWVWSDSGEDPWVTCGAGWCCGLDSD